MNFSPRPTAPKNFNTWHQNGFWWPRNTAVIALNRTPSTKVDLSWFKFVLQMHWPKSARWTGILIDMPNLKYKPIYKAQICIFLKTAKALHEMETVHVQEMIEYNNCHHKDWPWKKKLLKYLAMTKSTSDATYCCLPAMSTPIPNAPPPHLQIVQVLHSIHEHREWMILQNLGWEQVVKCVKWPCIGRSVR